jgi:hypothetical protein
MNYHKQEYALLDRHEFLLIHKDISAILEVIAAGVWGNIRSGCCKESDKRVQAF